MLKIDVERESDGRWLAEIEALPGVMAYGASAAEAKSRVTALGLRVIADRLDHGEALPRELEGLFAAA
jgi:predicted RNase H-like HicB family nuclease